MPEQASWQQKYGRRFIVNAVLLAVVWTLAWMWFNAHIKPHVSTLLFSGVSVATLATFGFAAFRSFFDAGEGQNIVRSWLRSPRLTPVVTALLPLLAAAHLTTFTVYLNADPKFPDVKLEVSRGPSKKPRLVVLSAAEKQKAVSYFFAVKAVTVRVATREPSGYLPLDVPLGRVIPTQLTVPDQRAAKPYHLLRLVPLYDLFQLRGRKEPDTRYTVRVFVPGRAEPIVHSGLSFRAIYLGAALDDLKDQSKNANAVIAGLHDRLRAVDGDMSEDDIRSVIGDWLDDPELMATPELKEGDRVRVEIAGPAGTEETVVKVAAKLNDVFLKGAAE